MAYSEASRIWAPFTPQGRKGWGGSSYLTLEGWPRGEGCQGSSDLQLRTTASPRWADTPRSPPPLEPPSMPLVGRSGKPEGGGSL